jgi:hypothetical protein
MNNPLLEKLKLPGRIFQLPSRGYLYINNELSSSVQNAEIHVHPMSALDEISMKNPDLLFSGKATDEVFKSCIPDIIKPLELYGRDVDAITLFLRIVSYGPIYTDEFIHTCKDAKKHTYNINVEDFVSKIKYLDPTMINDLYTLTLDNGQIVKLQPLRYKHVIEILQKNQNKKELTADDIKSNLMINLLNLIVSIDGISDKQLITEWIKKAPTSYINKIAVKVESSSDAWGCDFVTELTCKDCNEKFKVEIPINPVNFFTE